MVDNTSSSSNTVTGNTGKYSNSSCDNECEDNSPMDMEMFDPNGVCAREGIYLKSFHRGGNLLDKAIVKAGMSHYLKCGVESLEDRAKHVGRDLEKAGWIFRSSVFFDDRVSAIVVGAGVAGI